MENPTVGSTPCIPGSPHSIPAWRLNGVNRLRRCTLTERSAADSICRAAAIGSATSGIALGAVSGGIVSESDGTIAIRVVSKPITV